MDAVAQAPDLHGTVGVRGHVTARVPIDRVEVDVRRHDVDVGTLSAAVTLEGPLQHSVLIAAVLPSSLAALVVRAEGILCSCWRHERHDADLGVGHRRVDASDEPVEIHEHGVDALLDRLLRAAERVVAPQRDGDEVEALGGRLLFRVAREVEHRRLLLLIPEHERAYLTSATLTGLVLLRSLREQRSEPVAGPAAIALVSVALAPVGCAYKRELGVL